jgi:hypothetical protein
VFGKSHHDAKVTRFCGRTLENEEVLIVCLMKLAQPSLLEGEDCDGFLLHLAGQGCLSRNSRHLRGHILTTFQGEHIAGNKSDVNVDDLVACCLFCRRLI